MFKKIAVLFVALAMSGCVSTDAVNTAKVAAAGNDRYYTLSTQTLDGSVKEENGPAITKAELAKTPPSVKKFLGKLLGALHVNRHAFHSILFQLDEGSDPKDMGLSPAALPADENDDLAGDGQ